jgi:hypothetical protein
MSFLKWESVSSVKFVISSEKYKMILNITETNEMKLYFE